MVAAPTANLINVSWSVVSGATNYKLERKEGAGSYSQINNVAVAYSQSYCNAAYPTVACPNLSPYTNVYADSGRSPNTNYCYKLRSWNSSGDSVYSNEACVTTPLLVTSQSITATPLNSFVIRLDWVPMICTPSPCTNPEGFVVERMVKEGVWVTIATVGPEVTTFTDRRAIDPIKQYRYRISSYSGPNWSPYAEGVAFTPPYTPGDNVGP
jgi:titin